MIDAFIWRQRARAMPGVAVLLIAAAFLPASAVAQTRAETLVVVAEEGPSTLDIDAATANVPTHEVSWNIYDRLITHVTKTLPDGTPSYDYTSFKPELAESCHV